MATNVTNTANRLPAPTTYTIGGVKVEFPTKAYPSQLAMMNKVIQGLKHKQNCLLESPTGSGKSLALLCAALAWQRHEAARVREYNDAIDARVEKAFEDLKKQKQQPKRKTQENQRASNGNGKNSRARGSLESVDCSTTSSTSVNPVVDLTETDDDNDEDDFKPVKRCKSSSFNSTIPTQQIDFTTDYDDRTTQVVSKKSSDYETSPHWEDTTVDENCEIEDNSTSDYAAFVPPEKKLSVPKIFFGTRTHKQIAQITRELRKTVYVNSRSVILASRDHSCINPIVERASNKNEACRELLENQMVGGCGFHAAAKKFGSFGALPNYGVRPGYDLEDLVAAGRESKSCPYYASRYLTAAADIIFCPYNYLIDPFTRKSMLIELENHVVIFDEGHNMEDASRDAASFTINQDEIRTAIQDCEGVSHCGVEPYAHMELAKFLSTLCGWMDKQEAYLKSVDFDNSGKVWNGTELVASLDIEGISEAKIKKLQEYLKAVLVQRDKEIEMTRERGGRSKNSMSVTSATSYLLEVLFRMFEQLQDNGGRNRDDFRVAILQTIVRRRKENFSNARQVKSFNFWCLNPAIAFQEIQKMVHCIILTSGTLSPMQSFQSELGTPFQIKLEASHVIDKHQVWAGVVGTGPKNANLNGAYKNAETFSYQDELGELVRSVCREMNHGILCFLPSYRMLDTLEKRWTSTGIWNEISKIKTIFSEPRTGNADFQDIMNSYYESIASPMGGRTGALFLAVCRGKVSEGLDFADNNARAVICIGIPFPNFRDMQVEHKKDYNEKNRSRGLLSGNEWYEIQAFRALNQALGRCIRHRFDWGAILLVDDRYCKTPRYINSLSKWVRSSVKTYSNWMSCISNMISFRNQMHSHMLEASSLDVNLDVSVDMPEFHDAPREGGHKYENNENILPSSSNYFLPNRQSVNAPTFKPNPNHPIQFDDDDEEVIRGVPNLDSQNSDETFIIGGNNSAAIRPKLGVSGVFNPTPSKSKDISSYFTKNTRSHF